MRRLTAFLYAAPFILLPVVATLALFVPIYTDEVVWKIVQARYLLDRHAAIYVFPQCLASFSAAPPGWSTPILGFLGWVYSDLSDLFKLRVIGTFSYLAWMVTLWRFSLRLPALRGLSAHRTLALIISYLGLGVLPLAMVINRPEQPLLWGLTFLIFLPFILPREFAEEKSWAYPVLGLFHCVLWAALLTIHPKTALFLPVLLVSLFLTVRPWKIRVPALLTVALITFQTEDFWARRLSCPELPSLEALLHSHMMRPKDFISAPMAALRRGLNNVKNISIHFDNLGFSDRYNQDWLPPSSSNGLEQAVLTVGLDFLLIVSLLLALRWIYLGISKQKSGRTGSSRKRGAVVLALAVSIVFWSFLQGVKNFYEIALFFPLCGILLLLGFDREDYEQHRDVYRIIATTLLAVSLASQLNLIGLFAPEAAGPWRNGGYLKGQSASISPFHESEQSKKIIQTGRMCGIKDENLRHLAIDDLTYSVYWKTYQPYHIFFLREPWVNSSHLLQFLHESGSSGVVVGCGSLPSSLRSRALRNGEFCCLPGAG